MNFIDRYLEYTANYESPTAFWKWSAYATLAAVIRDSCFIRQQNLTVYPNIYVLALAQSSVDRKGMPTMMCEKLVRSINNTKLISGRTSIQALIHELGTSATNPETGKVISGGSAIFLAPELSAGLVGDSQSVGILTDIYDARGSYINNLKGSGKFEIKNICLTMLAASNADMLKGEGLFDAKGIFGGLLARTFLIKPDEFRKGSSLFNCDMVEIEAGFKELSHMLKELSMIHGPMILDVDAQTVWEDWYFPFRESYRGRTDKSGVSGRIHTSILKLAILFCLNFTKEKIIRKEHIYLAIEEATSLLPNYQEFVMGAGKNSMADVGTVVLRAIFESKDHCISKKNMLQKHWNDVDAETLDKLIDTFVQADLVKMDIDNRTSEVVYRMQPKCIDMLFPAQKAKQEGI